MEIIITTQRNYQENDYKLQAPLVLHRCKELKYLPRVGEYITFWDGWATETVKEVWNNIDDNTVTIVLHTIAFHELRKEVQRLKVKQYGE